MEIGGYAGNILHLDLTTDRVEKESVTPELAKAFIGGLGFSVKLAYEHIKPHIGALSPENTIIIGAGPLVGTIAPGSSRIYAAAKFPINNAIAWAGAGGMTFGTMLKNAGYDNVVIKGRASKPVYLKIFDDDVEICDAGELWGKGIEESCRRLWAKFGWPVGVITIGQAGENLVKFAMSYVDNASTLGRGGFGAVMGSKNLKGIIVKGTKGVRVSHPKRFMKLVDGLFQRIKRWEHLDEWHEFGFWLGLPVVPREMYYELNKARLSCISCPISDKDVVEIKKGKYKGLTKVTTTAINAVTPSLLGLSVEDSVKCTGTLDDYGMDMFEFFSVISFVNQLYDQGMITNEHMGSKIPFDLESLEKWGEKIANREGFGGILAEGLPGIIDKFGEESKRFAPPMAKGLSVYSGPTGPLIWNRFGTMEFSQLVNPRGAHVAAGGSPTYYAVRPLDKFPTHLDRMGVPESAVDRILPEPGHWQWGLRFGLVSPEDKVGLNVGRMTRYSENWLSVLGSLGVCARAQINRFYYASLLAELYSAATGIQIGKEELMKAGDRVWNLLKVANVKEGFGRKDDSFSPRWLEEKSQFIDYTGKVKINEEIADRFLDDYYQERGWDVDKGIPTREKLLELGLAEAAEEMARAMF
jgi:aldehyde:ferredoxin oxidoreductase